MFSAASSISSFVPRTQHAPQVAALRPKGSVIVEEAPSSRAAMHDYLPIIDRDGFYTCASGGLGHGLPAAIGVALARAHVKIIALLGVDINKLNSAGTVQIGQRFETIAGRAQAAW
jgi:thiamine pyrophosphate-dependent acetolactate synthase large subunit-like protein